MITIYALLILVKLVLDVNSFLYFVMIIMFVLMILVIQIPDLVNLSKYNVMMEITVQMMNVIQLLDATICQLSVMTMIPAIMTLVTLLLAVFIRK